MPLFFLWLAPIFGGGIFMPLEESVENFHPIDINIFDKNTDLVFNIFYKAQDASEDRFVLYASKEPRYRDKVRELLQSPDFMEELFIHEDDLSLYFDHATNSLRDYVLNSDASPEILRGSDQVVDLMEKCLSNNELGFYGL